MEFYLGKSEYIKEVLVTGQEEQETGEMIVWAEILPDFDAVREAHGDLTPEGLRKLLKSEIDKANDKMPLYKRVKRFKVRETEFEKTTTKKIKRYTAGQQ